MNDSILSGVLTLGLLLAGTFAVGSEMARPAERPTLTLPAVTVIGHRATPMEEITFPTVVVTARRAAPLQLAMAAI